MALVARAGINELDNSLDKHFRKLVTWAAPYHGSPLVTLRYVISEGYKLKDSSVPLPLMSQWPSFTDAINNGVALDTPGERDLRWDNYKPLNLAGLGWDLTKEQEGLSASKYLDISPNLYSSDLAAFNKSDKYGQFSGKYYALYGITDKVIEPHSYFKRRATGPLA